MMNQYQNLSDTNALEEQYFDLFRLFQIHCQILFDRKVGFKKKRLLLDDQIHNQRRRKIIRMTDQIHFVKLCDLDQNNNYTNFCTRFQTLIDVLHSKVQHHKAS